MLKCVPRGFCRVIRSSNGPLVAAVAVTGTMLLAGCGSAEDDHAASAAPSTAVSVGGAQPAQTSGKAAYNDPMDVVKEIQKARLGCAKPERSESLGSGKVICGGTDHISIEFYETPQTFAVAKKMICQMDATSTIVADEGQRWMVTSLSSATNKRIQQAVGGEVIKAC